MTAKGTPLTNSGDTWFRELLDRAARGDKRAEEELTPFVYEELRKLARLRLARLPAGETLHTTVLIHEAWLRVGGLQGWQGRRHFFGAAARAMRNVLVDRIRRERVQSRLQREDVDWDDVPLTSPGFTQSDFLALNEALTRLEQEYERPARVVVLSFFAALPHEEIASLLGITTRTVRRDLTFAHTWLHREMRRDQGKGSHPS